MKKILVVEDDVIISEFVCAMLIETEKYEPIAVYNGQEALNCLDNYKSATSRTGYEIAAIVLDLKMPVMDGMEFLSHLSDIERVRKKMIPIIVLSSYENYDIWQQISDFRLRIVYDYLKKPILPYENELLKTLERLFQYKNYEKNMYEFWCKGLDKMVAFNSAKR